MTEKQPDLADKILQITEEKKPETVNQLALLLKETNPSSEQEILEAIIKLQNDGKLKLTRQPQYAPLSFSAYLKTYDAAWYWISLAVTLASIAAIFAIPADLQPYVVIRYVFAIIFILWLPGYTFIKALFPQTSMPKPNTHIERTVQNLDIIERIALSMGMSLALVSIIGLLLNYTPWGIRLTPITLSLAALTLVFATAALLRENQNRKKPKI